MKYFKIVSRELGNANEFKTDLPDDARLQDLVEAVPRFSFDTSILVDTGKLRMGRTFAHKTLRELGLGLKETPDTILICALSIDGKYSKPLSEVNIILEGGECCFKFSKP